MSRSYKKHPFIKDQSYRKSGKKYANRKVRRSKDTLQHRDYKKQYCSWEISDYISYMSEDELVAEFCKSRKTKDHWMNKFSTLDEALSWWKKEYLGK